MRLIGSMAQARRVVHTTYALQFTDKKVALLIEANTVRAMDVVPHGDKFAVRVKDLDTMAFPILVDGRNALDP